MEFVSPLLADGFFTTEPPGKPSISLFTKADVQLMIKKLHLKTDLMVLFSG